MTQVENPDIFWSMNCKLVIKCEIYCTCLDTAVLGLTDTDVAANLHQWMVQQTPFACKDLRSLEKFSI